MILLTDEDICKATGWDYLSGDELILLNQSNEAQLKKVAGWGNEPCTEHKHSYIKDNELHHSKVAKRECPYCWQSLLDEVKE